MEALQEEEEDCIVIGGGLSGLVCANAIAQAGGQVRLLEARDRTGGRTCLDHVSFQDGSTTYCDTGGAYVGPTQDRLLHLAENLGINTFKVDMRGNHLVKDSCTGGKAIAYEGNTPPLSVMTMLDLNNLSSLTNKLAYKIRMPQHSSLWDPTEGASPLQNLGKLGEEQLTEYEKELDEMSVLDFLKREADGPTAIEYYTAAVQAVACCSPEEISLLFWLRCVKASGSVENVIDVEDAAQERKFEGGSKMISTKLERKLGDRIILSNPVRSIDYSPRKHVVVRTRDGTAYRGKYAVIAMAPSMYGKLNFIPYLPTPRQLMCDRMYMGCIIKTIMYFESQWWKELGFSGSIFDTQGGPVVVSYDDTKPDGKFPAIMGFVLADEAWKWSDKSEEERKNAILAQYGDFFGDIERARSEVCGYIEKNWNLEEFSGGCYGGIMPPGLLSRCSELLLKPLGRLHFAGTETSTSWTGYMEGAVQAGERAAHEVLWNLVRRDARGKIQADGLPLPAKERFHFKYPQSDTVICPFYPPPPVETEHSSACYPHAPTLENKVSLYLPSPKTLKAFLFGIFLVVLVYIVSEYFPDCWSFFQLEKWALCVKESGQSMLGKHDRNVGKVEL